MFLMKEIFLWVLLSWSKNLKKQRYPKTKKAQLIIEPNRPKSKIYAEANMQVKFCSLIHSLSIDLLQFRL